MSSNFSLSVQARNEHGKGASRRLRHSNLVPAIIYGGQAEPTAVSIKFNELVKALENEAFFSHVLTLDVDGKPEQVVIKALQRHPAKGFPMHADFQRVDAAHEMSLNVPLHFLNQETAKGVKQQGGHLLIVANEAAIRTLPANLPEFLEVDLINAEVGQTLHLSDVVLPTGVTLVELAHGHDLPIASIQRPAGGAEPASE